MGSGYHLCATWTGFVYLAVVLDVFSRKVVEWAMADHLRTELVLAALNMAFGKRCREMGVLTSTGSAGDCYDNAMAESFFATLECELIERRAFRTWVEARMAVFQFIEGWYNTGRRHSALGYRSPNEFERAALEEPERRTRDDHGLQGQTAPGAFPIRQSDLHDHPPGLAVAQGIEKALLPAAAAHFNTDGDSLVLSTKNGVTSVGGMEWCWRTSSRPEMTR